MIDLLIEWINGFRAKEINFSNISILKETQYFLSVRHRNSIDEGLEYLRNQGLSEDLIDKIQCEGYLTENLLNKKLPRNGYQWPGVDRIDLEDGTALPNIIKSTPLERYVFKLQELDINLNNDTLVMIGEARTYDSNLNFLGDTLDKRVVLKFDTIPLRKRYTKQIII